MELAELIAGSTGFAVCMSRVYKSLPGLEPHVNCVLVFNCFRG